MNGGRTRRSSRKFNGHNPTEPGGAFPEPPQRNAANRSAAPPANLRRPQACVPERRRVSSGKPKLQTFAGRGGRGTA
jgi:hypothetical protein